MHLVLANLAVKAKSRAAQVRQAAKEKMAVLANLIAQALAAAKEKMAVLANLIVQVKASPSLFRVIGGLC
jgi:hypothetical protein